MAKSEEAEGRVGWYYCHSEDHQELGSIVPPGGDTANEFDSVDSKGGNGVSEHSSTGSGTSAYFERDVDIQAKRHPEPNQAEGEESQCGSESSVLDHGSKTSQTSCA